MHTTTLAFIPVTFSLLVKLPSRNKKSERKAAMGEAGGTEKSSKGLRARFGKKERQKKKTGGGGIPRFGRQSSFNAGDADSAAIKAASEGFDPLILLRSTKPSLAGRIQVQKANMRMFVKWEEYWAEQRGYFVLLFPEKPSEEDWKRVDLTNTVRSLFSVSECAVSMERKQEKIIRLSKKNDSITLRFDTINQAENWGKKLSEISTIPVARLSDFEIIAPIGKGAAGRVFLVRHKETGKKMALKAIEKEESVYDSRSSYRHAVDERAVLGLTVGKPSFVQLRYAFQTNTNIYLVTDFCDGGDLFFYVAANQCGLDEDRARFIVAEIILAMECLHELDVIYRDLKPENILLDGDGHVRIADFGLSKRLESGIPLGRTGTICGTHSYVAPEMVSAKTYGSSVDIFTIGIFLYHIMVGRPPFDAANMDDVKENVVRLNEIQYYEDFMSSSAIDFLKRVLTTDPKKRFGCSDKGLSELRQHPFFEPIDWDHLREKTGPHAGGLFSGGFEIPEGMEKVLKKKENEENSDPNGRTKSGGPWYEPDTNDDDHLLRNFDLSEWEGVRVDDQDDSNEYGDASMWPLFKFHKRDLDHNYICGYSFGTKQT